LLNYSIYLLFYFYWKNKVLWVLWKWYRRR